MAWSFSSMAGPAGGGGLFAHHHAALFWITGGAFGLPAAGVRPVFGAKVTLHK